MAFGIREQSFPWRILHVHTLNKLYSLQKKYAETEESELIYDWKSRYLKIYNAPQIICIVSNNKNTYQILSFLIKITILDSNEFLPAL